MIQFFQMTSARATRPRVLLVNRAIVLNDRKEILLVQRAKDDTNYPNLWEFPGGKLDAGQDIANALEREVLEETGLFVIPQTRVAYVESYIVTNSKRYNGLPYVVLVGICKMIGGNLQLSFEHQDYKWVRPKKAYTFNLRDETRKALAALEENLR